VVRLDGAVSSGNRYSLFSQGQSDAAWRPAEDPRELFERAASGAWGTGRGSFEDVRELS
jgi:hypothetical protein